MMKRNAILTALLSVLFPLTIFAGSFRLKWTEIDVVLDKDGKAQVSYAVRWTSRNAPLHGFYFEGFQENPVFDYNNAYALDNKGRRYGLEIIRLSPFKYDIVLEKGQAFYDGEITYFFRYAADLQASGQVVYTMAGNKKLAVFNWAPVQWSDGMEHETVVVYFPVTIEEAGVSPETLRKINFLTEKFVNKKYLIDYPIVQNQESRNIFTARFHRNNPGRKFHFQIQVYLNGSYFNLSSSAAGVTGTPQVPHTMPSRERYILNRFFPGSVFSRIPMNPGQMVGLILAILILFVTFPVFVMTRKHMSMLTASEGISGINWEGTEWVPPKIQISTYRTPGKIANNLAPVEAGLLIELPVHELLSLMLANMERKGILKIKHSDPLIIARNPAVPMSNDPYETALLSAIKPDGTLDTAGVTHVLKTITAGVEQKIWDCDLEATQKYYRSRLNRYIPGAGEIDEDYYWRGYRHYLFTRNDQYYTNADQIGTNLGQSMLEFKKSFSDFRTSAMCYEGAFAQSVCHDACHSACHDACHSACHSACHGACHGACVSSGH